PAASRPRPWSREWTPMSGRRTSVGREAAIGSTSGDGADEPAGEWADDAVVEGSGSPFASPLPAAAEVGAGGAPTCWVAAHPTVPPPATSSTVHTGTTHRGPRCAPCRGACTDQRVLLRRPARTPAPPRPTATAPRVRAAGYSMPPVLLPPVSTPPSGMDIWAWSSSPQAAGTVASRGSFGSRSDMALPS